jgi:diaminopimelate decarboxylase
VKSNPLLSILEDLSSNGAGFDCASMSEIKLAKKLGLD